MFEECWCQDRTPYAWEIQRNNEIKRQLELYKHVDELVKLHETLVNVKPPCEWKNGNICVAEGCFGEACLKMDLGKDPNNAR